MIAMTRIRLAEDFSPFPFGRFPKQGPFSGERFREEMLVPALQRDEFVEVDLSGAKGLSPSFLEEAFGGLVRRGYQTSEVQRRVRVVLDSDPSIVALVQRYIVGAGQPS